MKYLLIVVTSLLLNACGTFGNEDAKREREFQELYAANEEKRNKHRIQDSINSIEEKIAIGKINFGIDRVQFKKDRDAFMKEIEVSQSKNSWDKRYSIGEYFIRDIQGEFHKDKLYRLRIKGERVKYDEYDDILTYQYNSLIKIFTQKYGMPRDNNGLPNWVNVKINDAVRCASWKLGKKEIDIDLKSIDAYYTIDIDIREMTMWLEEMKGLGDEIKKKEKDALNTL